MQAVHTHLVPSSLSDQAYRHLVEGIADYAVVLLKPDRSIASWNFGAQLLKGYEEKEVLGLDFFSFFVADETSGIAADLSAELAADGRFESEGWCHRKDGTRFWAHLTIKQVLDDDGATSGYVAICRDRTMRRSAEGLSRRSEERFRQLIDGFRDHAICMLDDNGRIGSWSDDLERLLGYTSGEIVGSPFATLFSLEDQKKGTAERALDTAMQCQRLHYTGWHLGKSGQLVPVSEIIDSIDGENGTHSGFAVVMRDRSVQQATEAALENARMALSKSQRLELIGTLTGGLAHDFNNLLSAIVPNLELSRRRVDPKSDARKFIDNALTGAQRGAALVARMMSFVRDEPPQTRTVSIPKLIEGLEHLVWRAIGPGIAVETTYAAQLAAIEIDPHQLELALMNLFVNSRDAMPDGGTIRITARNRLVDTGKTADLRAQRYVELKISDTGTGMDAATLDRALELFFTTKPAGKGTGLGLPMVQTFIDSAKGHMSIESRPGKGTTISLLLPALRSVRFRTVADDSIEAEDLDSPSERRLRILVVDDDALVLLNTAAMLADLGHETVEAGSGRDAIRILQDQDSIDVMITDYSMPHMTGAELASAVRANWPSVRVIVASGYSDDAILENTIANAKLQKPFGIRDLRATIDKVMCAETFEKKTAEFEAGDRV